MLVAACIWGGAIAGFGLTTDLVVGVVLLAIAGMADMANGVFRATILQLDTPDAFRGRVNSVGFVVGEVGPSLGNVEAGVVAAITSAGFSAVSGGLACIVGSVLVALATPVALRYRASTGTKAQAAAG
jgi:hypothetical protein